jgi:hypothetical protein
MPSAFVDNPEQLHITGEHSGSKLFFTESAKIVLECGAGFSLQPASADGWDLHIAERAG